MSLSTFVTKAESQIGNDGTTYQTWYGITGNWCAMFVSWCANEASILTNNASAEPPYVCKEASVYNMRQWYNDNHRAFVISSSTTSANYPKVGDVVTVCTDGSGVNHTHVGIVVETDGNKITTVEGNLNNPNNISTVKKVTYTDLSNADYGNLLWLLSNHVSW